MIMCIRAVLLSFAFFIYTDLTAQPDSILAKGRSLQRLAAPTAAQIEELYNTALTFKYTLPDTALVWTILAEKKATAINDSRLAIRCLYLESMIRGIKGQYLLSIQKAEEGISWSRRIADDSLLAVGYNGAGISRTHMGKFDDALASFKAALNIREKIKDEKGIAATLSSIGQLYYESGDPAEAIKYLDRVLSTKDNEKVLLITLHTRANIYGVQGDYEKALDLDRKGLEMAKKMNAVYAFGMFYDNIANCYLAQNKYDKAAEYFQKTLEIDSRMNNKKQMGDTWFNLASMEASRGNQGKAIQYGIRALQLQREGEASGGAQKTLEFLAESHAEAGHFREAYFYKTKADALEDSLVSEKTKTKLDEFNVLYETARKETEIGQLKDQQQINKLSLIRNELLLEKRNYQIITIGGILLFLSAIAWFLYNRQRLRQRQIQEKAILDAEYKERIRIARDVHDDLGSGLSRISLMAEVAKDKSGGDQDVKNTIGHIAGVSKELVENMRDLVWVLNPANTSPDNLIARMREYISEYLEEANIEVAFDLPATHPDLKLPRDIQRNVFLTVKEAIHNIVKHSHATNIFVDAAYEGTGLSIRIQDDGRGFHQTEILQKGNGLRNMRQRIESIGGQFEIHSDTGGGTSIRMQVNLAGEPVMEKITL
jgi:signal transduction histidine kinase